MVRDYSINLTLKSLRLPVIYCGFEYTDKLGLYLNGGLTILILVPCVLYDRFAPEKFQLMGKYSTTNTLSTIQRYHS